MPTIGEVYKKAVQETKPLGIWSADLRILICFDEGFAEQIDVVLNQDKEMKHVSMFEKQVERLKKGEPVEYIVNQAKFLENKLFVDQRVLIPRSETEELVANITELITDYYDPRNYLVCADIGTGSGAITIALKQYFPNWIFVSSDISQDAIDVAKINFTTTKTQTTVLKGDALKPYIDAKMNLDIIVCNPPYILNKEDAQQSVVDYEPGSALWMDKDNSVYEKIFKDYKKVKKGTLLMAFEISPDLVDFLKELMEKYLENYRFKFIEDLNRNVRFLFIYCE